MARLTPWILNPELRHRLLGQGSPEIPRCEYGGPGAPDGDYWVVMHLLVF